MMRVSVSQSVGEWVRERVANKDAMHQIFAGCSLVMLEALVSCVDGHADWSNLGQSQGKLGLIAFPDEVIVEINIKQSSFFSDALLHRQFICPNHNGVIFCCTYFPVKTLLVRFEQFERKLLH